MDSSLFFSDEGLVFAGDLLDDLGPRNGNGGLGVKADGFEGFEAGLDASGDGFGGAVGGDEGVKAVLEVFCGGGAVNEESGGASGGGFAQDHGGVVVEAGEDEKVGKGVEGGEVFFVADEAEELDFVF